MKNNKYFRGFIIGVGLGLVILVALFSVVQVKVYEDGSFEVWAGGDYGLREVQTFDSAGNSYTYVERVGDTRNILASGQIPFLFGEGPEWWSEVTGEEWLHPAEYIAGGPLVQCEFGTCKVVISGWDHGVTDSSFWNCFHSIGLCVLRHDDRPLVYR